MSEHGALREDLSARLDGELDARRAAELEAHLEVCDECRAYERNLARVRSAVRLGALEEVPDLSEEILRRIQDERSISSRRSRWTADLRIASIAAAAAALILFGTSAPWRSSQGDVAGANEIVRSVRSAATRLDGYHAVMRVTERGWHPDIPVRRFRTEIWFDAPERLRLQIRDLTDYPDVSWPQNDVTVIASPEVVSIQEPYSCPVDALPGCSIASGTERRTVRNRPPFDGSSTMPTDLILPLESVASSGRFSVEGETVVAGRSAYRIGLDARSAAPLIAALQPGGAWTPIDPDDTVEMMLDAETWFPLRLEIRSGETLVLTMSVLRFDVARQERSLFSSRVPGDRDAGWSARSPSDVDTLLPGYTAGLRPYRSGTVGGRTTVVSYAEGLTWLKISYGPRTPIPIDPGEPVELSAGITGYYLPADQYLRRTIDIFERGRHIRVESNLPRAELVRVAGTLEITQPVRQAKGLVTSPDLLPGSFEQPGWLPDGYEFSNAVVSGDRNHPSVVAHYRTSEIEFIGDGITIAVTEGIELLPPSSMESRAVRISGVVGRWVPERGELEWIDGSIHYVVRAPSFDLGTVAHIAGALR